MLFYELLDSVSLTGICFFTVCTLACGLLTGGRLFMNSVNIVKGRTSFEPKMEGGKANSFKRGNMGLFCGEIHGCT